MGLFDQIAGQALGALGGSGGGAPQGQLFSLITSLVTQHGGLEGLLKQFAAKGLGDHAASWVSTGKNLPINGEQLTQVFGAEKVQQLAQQAGLPAGAVSAGLADLLPKVVDHLTPQGNIGAQDGIQAGLQKLMQGGLGGLLGR
ncbi:hypothetical protein LBMAG56_01000 [Verrucomicrobiota bacterium]|nr:hypothetical protein LBMAG56_01000 [Verrucomicrobiota bacterium]